MFRPGIAVQKHARQEQERIIRVYLVNDMAFPRGMSMEAAGGITTRNRVQMTGEGVIGMEAVTDRETAAVMVGMACNPVVNSQRRTSSSSFWPCWRRIPRMATSLSSRWKIALRVSTFPAPA